MESIRDLPKSEVVARLKVFYEEYEAVHQGPEIEPPLGHYTPNLFFSPGRPDDHYFQAAGEEVPPRKPANRPDLTLKTIITWCMVAVLAGELILIIFGS